MSQNRFSERLGVFDAWKSEISKTLQEFSQWLETQDRSDGEADLRIFETLEALRDDRLTLAFMAEFSRGKTELINAIFFANYGRRLLPSEAGRTTMCPTELLYDRKRDESYLRLLPIESRSEERSIAEMKKDPAEWVNLPLETDSADQMADTLREVIKTKIVPVDKARELGLYDESQDPHFQKTGEVPEQVEIPMWRHALISFPHPLLQQGLVILDTPGLNALGTEPELTMSLLPSAQAILFVLAADTGVTRSDLDMWKNHAHVLEEKAGKHLVVALNKIDTLWDDLKDEATVDAGINNQCRKVSELLHVDTDRVFPLSAQKALVGKVREDAELLVRSRLPELEDFLSEQVLDRKMEVVRDHIEQQIGAMLESNQALLRGRLEQTAKELNNLNALRGKNAEVISHLMRKSREEQSSYLRNVESFQSSKRVLQSQAKAMQDVLSLDSFDQLISKTRKEMTGSWTTHDLKRGMTTFFEGASGIMEQVSGHAEQTRRLIRATYRKFHEEHGLPEIKPEVFSVDGYLLQLRHLVDEADAFRNSPVTAMTEQSFVIKKFFISLVAEARNCFFKANQEADTWIKSVMNPLVDQIKDHKRIMEKRLDTLRRINESRDTLETKISELETLHGNLARDYETVTRLHDTIRQPLPGSANASHPSENKEDLPISKAG